MLLRITVKVPLMKNDKSTPKENLEPKNPAIDRGTEAGVSEDSISKADGPVISPGLSSTIEDEVLRSRIRDLIAAKPAPSSFQRISTNPLTSVIIGFLLTGFIGGVLANYYNNKQKELETQRTKAQRESDRLREDQQRESDRLNQERQKDNEYQRTIQQRESERLKDVRQKDIEFQRAIQQRESERLRDIRQKGSEERLKNKELIARLDLEIGHRFSQIQIQLASIVVWEGDEHPFPFQPGKGENDVKAIIDSLAQPPTAISPSLYQEFSNLSTLALIAELRRHVPANEQGELDQVVADLSGIYIHLEVKKANLSNVFEVGTVIFEDLTLPRWRQGSFYFSDCPFC